MSFVTFAIIILLSIQITYAQTPYYYLCGPDEDGCYPGIEQYCACIPVSNKSDQPYCLDLDNLTCKPTSEKLGCNIHMTFKNQAACLATLYQSEPEPPCQKVTDSFCSSHGVYICDKDGNPNSCKKEL